MNLKDKIIEYENDIFNEFIEKRNKFINYIKNIDMEVLSKEQVNNLIYDIKMILEPIKTSSENIDYIFTNTEFDKNNSEQDLINIQNVVTFYSLINQSQN
jgi:hypothetical protein